MVMEAGFRIGPYEIVSLLGTGGMGEVYKARDTRLHRVIALKTLAVEKVAEADRKRLLLEAQAASRLNHRSIVTIHDIAEENGVCFIAMEYVAGVTLECLIEGRGLPVKEAMQYAAEIADALAAAHAAGIIHRDLKPANIIVGEDGRIKLLDFGLAKLTEPGHPTQTASLNTVPGTIVGTAAYMSPEQAEGRALDARSDIFAFGLVLYEMLCGRRAFGGDTWISTLAAILHEEPRPMREVKAGIPAAMEQHVQCCLRKDPAQRFQTMLEVKQALAKAATATGSEEEPQSIAVLPFVNLSADKENEYFGDGLAEEIINVLANVPELKVIARTSAFAFRGKEQDLRAIGERLGVGTILEGSVRRLGNRIRVMAQLIRVSDQSHLWSERYDREMTDIFAIQDEISQAIANALKVRLGAPQRRTRNIKAFQSYQKGVYWYQRFTAESLAKAQEAFEQTVTQDPGYAQGYAGMAQLYWGLGSQGAKPMSEMAVLAKSMAQRALAIDPMQREAHTVLGEVVGAIEYDWEAAERHFQAALADPAPSRTRVRYAIYFLAPLSRFAEAKAQYQQALETDPLSMMVNYGVTFANYCEGRYDEAIEDAARAAELYPDYWMVHMALGQALAHKGCVQQSIVNLETAVRLTPAFAMAYGFLAASYSRVGDRGRAERVLEQAKVLSSRHHAACFAIYYASCGERDKMFECLRTAQAERDPYLTRMDAEPYFQPFRSDPRYQELMNKMNLSVGHNS